jgi:hypothetical protein
MRDLETIDSELRLLAAIRRLCREGGRPMPSIAPTDELLDERGRVEHTRPGRTVNTPTVTQVECPGDPKCAIQARTHRGVGWPRELAPPVYSPPRR